MRFSAGWDWNDGMCTPVAHPCVILGKRWADGVLGCLYFLHFDRFCLMLSRLYAAGCCCSCALLPCHFAHERHFVASQRNHTQRLLVVWLLFLVKQLNLKPRTHPHAHRHASLVFSLSLSLFSHSLARFRCSVGEARATIHSLPH